MATPNNALLGQAYQANANVLQSLRPTKDEVELDRNIMTSAFCSGALALGATATIVAQVAFLRFDFNVHPAVKECFFATAFKIFSVPISSFALGACGFSAVFACISLVLKRELFKKTNMRLQTRTTQLVQRANASKGYRASCNQGAGN